MVKPLGVGYDGETVSELAAFCVHPDYRGSGRGDSLLAYLGTYRGMPAPFFVAIRYHANTDQPCTFPVGRHITMQSSDDKQGVIPEACID